MTAIAGIDISKLKFDVVLLIEGKTRHRVFANDDKGFEVFSGWLDNRRLWR